MAETASSQAPNGSKDRATLLQENLSRYEQERNKRLRPERFNQYLDLTTSENLKSLVEDPWVEAEGPSAAQLNIPKDNRCRVIIAGAGYGGILFAIRLIQQGISPEDIRLVDRAGGFGGVWYWNRFPGLMCDVESYCYLPLLEDTGYIPKHRYSYANEIREYLNMLAEKWGLKDKALFQTEVTAMTWDDEGKEWVVDFNQQAKGQEERKFTIRSQFAMVASGLLYNPKIPSIPGVQDFKGPMFHASRWDYSATGGSPEDWDLAKLKDKTVGIVGTASTSVQVVPQLGRCAKQLYVFQRTPAAVDYRDQRETNVDSFKRDVATAPGWQMERNANYASHHYAPLPPPEKNLVDDAWTKMSTLSGLVGTPAQVTMENMGSLIAEMNDLDFERMQRVRARVDSTVKDEATAQKLKAWYQSWCKRPAFHDDYLETFNRPNVELIDTDGRGVSAVTAEAVKVDDKEYPVDVLIFGTGYRPFLLSNMTNQGAGKIDIRGKGGEPFDGEGGRTTLHGVISRGFPNLFFTGMSQGPVGSNFGFAIDLHSQHIAHIVSQAEKRVPPGSERRFAIEPSPEAEAAWGDEIAKRALVMAVGASCTPSSFNAEGAEVPPEELPARMRLAPWAGGITEYIKFVESWREKGDLEGLVITT